MAHEAQQSVLDQSSPEVACERVCVCACAHVMFLRSEMQSRRGMDWQILLHIKKE